MSVLPNLIIIGSMKCGTTSLHQYLSLHPSIWMSTPKELNFFSGECSGQSLEWYKSHFNGDFAINGESSQNYSKRHHPLYRGAPSAMKRLIPDAKLIYLVRDPVERYISHVNENYFGESAQDMKWNTENDHQIKTGLYFYQLQAFLDYFPLEQIAVVDVFDLERRRDQTMKHLFNFLGLDSGSWGGCAEFIANSHVSKTLPIRMQRSLLYRASNAIFPKATDIFLNSRLGRCLLLPGSTKLELNVDARRRLEDRFREDVNNFRALLKRSFLHWSV